MITNVDQVDYVGYVMVDDITMTPGHRLINNHTCKWFAYQVRAEFEPTSDGTFKKVDYIYMFCNCSAAKKSVAHKDTV